jgi:hypothetical protein
VAGKGIKPETVMKRLASLKLLSALKTTLELAISNKLSHPHVSMATHPRDMAGEKSLDFYYLLFLRVFTRYIL